TVALVLVGKTLLIAGILRLLGRGGRSALATGLCLAQFGEFSIVLLTMARGGVVGERLFMLVAGTTILTLLLSPYLVALGSRLAMPGASKGEEREETGALEMARGVIIVGFGPAGQAVARAVQPSGAPITVIELSRHTAAQAEAMQLPTIIGDASQIDVLEHARLDRARAVVVTLPDPSMVRRIVELVRELSPNVLVAARVRYHRRRPGIEAAGVHYLVDEEELVGAELGRSLLSLLKTTPTPTVEPASGSP
ncbi:MAG: NAD-binding protein, partial [Phycisphaerales bacterium JB038]